jgi:hypothetical protein
LFLGGYLLNPSVLMQVAALVVWVGTGERAGVFDERAPNGSAGGATDKHLESGVLVLARSEPGGR